MAARLYYLLVFLFWLAAMTWLIVEKVMPPMLGGNPPDYRSALAEPEEEPDCWKITWNGQSIGLVVTQIVDRAPRGREMRSVVRFEDLPLESMMSELLGAFASFAGPLLGTTPDYKIQAVLATRLAFDENRRLTEFSTVLDLAETPGFLTVSGRVTDGRRLAVVARFAGDGAGSGTNGAKRELRHELDLPPNALVGDSFTPRGELKGLQVGQSWTIPVYRAFPPNSPVQIVEAKVERHDIILWEGNDVETMLVVYRTDAGSGLRAASHATAREWVRPDGTVLRQELAFSGLTLRFERQMRGPLDVHRAYLDVERHPRYWIDVLSTH
ncbi:MAG: hypothetical protein ACC628_02255 [Pirellulaceae bacterium]